MAWHWSTSTDLVTLRSISLMAKVFYGVAISVFMQPVCLGFLVKHSVQTVVTWLLLQTNREL